MNEITTRKSLTITQQVYYKVFIDAHEVGYGWTERSAIEYAERYIKSYDVRSELDVLD